MSIRKVKRTLLTIMKNICRVKRRVTVTGEKQIMSQDIRVGHLIKIQKDQRVPADLLFLHTTDKSGTVFVRTDQLDGETDWKIREAVKVTQNLGNESIARMISQSWTVNIEEPNDLIYDFKGSFCSEENNTFQPLKLNQTIWANMKVASGEIIGLVIYAGRETKMAQNSRRVQPKYGKTDEEINTLSKFLFFILGLCTFGLFFLSGKVISTEWYVFLVRTFILLSSIIPVSMKVNIDFAKLFYSLLINQDTQIEGTIARNSSIPEELGRIEYLLSDKTGTLTRNEMIFKNLKTPVKSFSVETFIQLKALLYKIYNNPEINNSNDPLKDNNQNKKIEESIKNCLLCFILCNNVSPIIDNGERVLQASSPDEVALVKFAETMGYTLDARTHSTIVITTPNKITESYEILDNFPFNSETKRMGIILKNEVTKEIYFFLKGADIVIQEKLNFEDRTFVQEEADSLSKEGLRTLVLSYKMISEEVYADFKQKLLEAGKNLQKREKLELRVIESLEKDMSLLGITGVEDLLQEDIRTVIQNIKEAGIKVWMLTGDKLETAKCIAISTGFKGPSQKFYEIQSLLHSELSDLIFNYDPSDNALLVTGAALEIILKTPTLRELFFSKAKYSSSVILCRCAPKQKALVALYLKAYLGKVVCCIGDGGNDVGMIQTGNIGIGIEGKEGLQAALASDFSVRKFKNILKLFLWHGRLSYVRTSLLANFVVHRGLIITTIQILFMIVFNFVSLSIYNGNLIACYATIFTNFPVFCLIWDIDIPLHQAFNYPSLYSLVQKGLNLSKKVFLIWLWKSIFQGSIIILLLLQLFDNTFLEIITITFTALIIIEFLNIFSAIRTWHSIMTIGISVSAFTYLVSLIFMKNIFLLSDVNMESLVKIIFISLTAWMPLQITQTISRTFFPSQIDKVIKEAKVKEVRKRMGMLVKMHDF